MQKTSGQRSNPVVLVIFLLGHTLLILSFIDRINADSTTDKLKGQKDQTMFHKTLHGQRKFEQCEPHCTYVVT